jgi:hypothetical protein
MFFSFYWVIPRLLNFYVPTFRNTLYDPSVDYGIDRVSWNMGTYNSDAGETPKRENTIYPSIAAVLPPTPLLCFNPQENQDIMINLEH